MQLKIRGKTEDFVEFAVFLKAKAARKGNPSPGLQKKLKVKTDEISRGQKEGYTQCIEIIDRLIRSNDDIPRDDAARLKELIAQLQRQQPSTDEVPVDVLSAANYLIQLYHNVKGLNPLYTYNCTTTKLGKLLTLALWIDALSRPNCQALFNECVIPKKCGTTIETLTLKLGNKVFVEGNDCGGEILDTVITKMLAPSTYSDILLTFIFKHFGAYESYLLGEYINEYKPFDSDKNISIGDFVSAFKEKDRIYSDKYKQIHGNALLPLSEYEKKWREFLQKYD